MSKGRGRKSKQANQSRAAPVVDRTRGGKWEAMHGDMTSYYEIRLTGPGREQFRLFCLLENGTDDELLKRGLVKPSIAVIDGRRKPWRTVLGPAYYRAVKQVGEEHNRQFPRRIAT